MLNTWTGIQINASSTSISLSWETPPRSFFAELSVQAYLVLYTNFTRIYQASWLPGNDTNITVSGLQPFTNFSLMVVAVLNEKNRSGNTGWIRVQTDEGGKMLEA